MSHPPIRFIGLHHIYSLDQSNALYFVPVVISTNQKLVCVSLLGAS